MAWLRGRFADQTREMGYSRWEVERKAERASSGRDFVDDLNHDKRWNGDVPDDLRRDAERYQEDVRYEKRQEERREQEEQERAEYDYQMRLEGERMNYEAAMAEEAGGW